MSLSESFHDEEETVRMLSTTVHSLDPSATSKRPVWEWDVAEEIRFVQKEAYDREYNSTQDAVSPKRNLTSLVHWAKHQRVLATTSSVRSQHSLVAQAVYYPMLAFVWLSYPFKKAQLA
eukprot:CAMPEP_0172452574 /NCGR_PEP_ID=MMETSP1065-20121228/10188_1 /TAXON_ID=265537 /ORGANISM="Amphiprora paludosa, Strain CCMP125" /LENGTH=118 /DNA_ID=CAMNT_0013204647 /DNA_START=285 /DNA_END=641 /DNA_ORIENTATION=+